MTHQNINYEEYAKLTSGFYPIEFDAAEWVSAIKASGAKYICITSRHHDGFSMFKTNTTAYNKPYNIVDSTPFGRDILKELADECVKQDIKLHLYYSLIDWYRDDYLPLGSTGRGTGRPGEGEWSDYLDFMCEQITEYTRGRNYRCNVFVDNEKLDYKQYNEGLFITFSTTDIADEIDFVVQITVK